MSAICKWVECLFPQPILCLEIQPWLAAGWLAFALCGCRARVAEERKQWRRDHPYGFYARPTKNADGSLNMMLWEVGIPGKEGTIWAGGLYKLEVHFPEDYPSKPPKCKFTPPLFHPNVYPSGTVRMSILKEEKSWTPEITMIQIVLAIQDLMNNPNMLDPAQVGAWQLRKNYQTAYEAKIKEQARSMAAWMIPPSPFLMSVLSRSFASLLKIYWFRPLVVDNWSKTQNDREKQIVRKQERWDESKKW